MQSALAAVPGVTKVDVSFEDKSATVDASPCNTDEMIAALSKVGYRAALKP